MSQSNPFRGSSNNDLQTSRRAVMTRTIFGDQSRAYFRCTRPTCRVSSKLLFRPGSLRVQARLGTESRDESSDRKKAVAALCGAALVSFCQPAFADLNKYEAEAGLDTRSQSTSPKSQSYQYLTNTEAKHTLEITCPLMLVHQHQHAACFHFRW